MTHIYILLLATFINGHDDWYMVEEGLTLAECVARAEELEVHLSPATEAVCEIRWEDE
jgi:hypothetical protein